MKILHKFYIGLVSAWKMFCAKVCALDEMLQELPGAGQFIIVMDTWFERLMAE